MYVEIRCGRVVSVENPGHSFERPECEILCLPTNAFGGSNGRKRWGTGVVGAIGPQGAAPGPESATPYEIKEACLKFLRDQGLAVGECGRTFSAESLVTM